MAESQSRTLGSDVGKKLLTCDALSKKART